MLHIHRPTQWECAGHREQPVELALSFHHMGSRAQARIIRFGSKPLRPLSHLTSSAHLQPPSHLTSPAHLQPRTSAAPESSHQPCSLVEIFFGIALVSFQPSIPHFIRLFMRLPDFKRQILNTRAQRKMKQVTGK